MTHEASQGERTHRDEEVAVDDFEGATRLSRRFELLTQLLERRQDLRGAYGLADHLDEAVRWSA